MNKQIMKSTKSLNILYHHRTQGRGAEGVHIVSIIKAFEAMGHTVTLVSPPGVDPLSEAGNAPVDKSNVKTRGISTVWQIISNYMPNFLFEVAEILYNFNAARSLERKLRSDHFDLIYERYAFYLISGAIKAKKYGIPIVLEANEVSGLQERARHQVFKSLCSIFERFLFSRCDAIHTVSSYLKQKIIETGTPAHKVFVAPNAVDPEDYLKFIPNAQLRDFFGLQPCHLVLGFAGWFDHWDRLDLLVEVFSELAVEEPNLRLMLIGDGIVLDEVREKVRASKLKDKVILTGAVPRAQIRQYLSLLDIAVFTHSNQFGSPVVMFEFMGLKIPIVAPRLMPITDVLADRTSALLFSPMNMSQMKSALKELIQSEKLRAKISENAWKSLMSKHRWQDNARLAIESVFDKGRVNERVD